MIRAVQERLQKILAQAGLASRRAAEKLLVEGRVTVNGTVVTELGSKADPARDEIRVDGQPVRRPERHVYLALYKPRGVVSTRRDPEGRPTVMQMVPPIPGLFPVGRLDTPTEGLLLLTNDGGFAERASHPRYEVPRVYHAKVHRIPEPETLARLTRGVVVEGERLAADAVRILEAGANAWLEVRLHEGKRHEVRRLLEAVGHKVSKLKRVAFGPVTLKGLGPGGFRELTGDEVRRLKAGGAAAARPPARPAAHPSVRPARPAPRPSVRPARTAPRPSGSRPSAAGTRRRAPRPR